MGKAPRAEGTACVESNAQSWRHEGSKIQRKTGGLLSGVWRPLNVGLERTAGGPGLDAKAKVWPLSPG